MERSTVPRIQVKEKEKGTVGFIENSFHTKKAELISSVPEVVQLLRYYPRTK